MDPVGAEVYICRSRSHAHGPATPWADASCAKVRSAASCVLMAVHLSLLRMPAAMRAPDQESLPTSVAQPSCSLWEAWMR